MLAFGSTQFAGAHEEAPSTEDAHKWQHGTHVEVLGGKGDPRRRRQSVVNRLAGAFSSDAEPKTLADSVTTIAEAPRFTKPQALICVFGGASGLHDLLMPNLKSLVAEGVVQSAVELDAMLITGGTLSGVMSMVGKGLLAIGPRQVRAIGVAPRGWSRALHCAAFETDVV